MPRGPLRPGARVGAFVVREEIGRGATSVVYEAEHRALRHPVAVKVLRSSSEMDRELRLRFEREMRLCSTLSSPHVPYVYDVGEMPSGLPFIVMERLTGASLADWLGIHRRLPVAVAVEVGIQICNALAALHHHHVVHRDVKPENLVLHRAEDDGYIVKLVDFGICKPLHERGPALTQTGTVVGTPDYMSPEQVQGIEVDARTDVYSTGVVLYELLAGRTPFEGRDLDSIGRAILFASPPRLSAVQPEVSAVLEGIVMRAMARDRVNRPPSIGALARELERFADEHALRRHPAVWDLLPAERISRTPPPPPARAPRETTDTLVIPRLPMRRAGVVGTAFTGIAILLGAIGSIAYYVYQPAMTGALIGELPKHPAVPMAPEVEHAQPERRSPVLGSLIDDHPTPAHAEDRVEPDHAPSPEERATEPVRVRDEARHTERQSSRVRSHHRRHAARETVPARTTVAFAPTIEAPEVAPSSVSAADIYAQVETQPRPITERPIAPIEPRAPAADALGAPRSSEPPRSPYERPLPNNPFD